MKYLTRFRVGDETCPLVDECVVFYNSCSSSEEIMNRYNREHAAFDAS